MTVEDLMKSLKDLDPKMPVVLSSDEEGNNFHNLHQAGELRFVPGPYGQVDIYNPDEAPKKAKPCVVLWPA